MKIQKRGEGGGGGRPRMQLFLINWYQNLYLVLFSTRSSLKEDLDSSPAELVYGQTLRLPQDPSIPLHKSLQINEFVFRLKKHFKDMKAPPTRVHHNKGYKDKNL